MTIDDYPPLTSEQQKIMSDKSIEMYNKMREKLIKESDNG